MTDNTQSKSKWQEETDTIAQEEGGGDFYGGVKYGWGFKAFVSGVDNHDTWFPYNRQDKTGKSKEDALGKYKQAIVKYGLEPKKLETVFAMWMEADQIFGRDTSAWKTNSIWWVEKVWSSGMKEIIIPSMEKLNVDPYAGFLWGKVSQAPDPDGYKKTSFDAEGKEVVRTKRIAYISAIYQNEKDCRTAAEKDTGESTPTNGVSVEDEIRQVHADDPEMTLYEIGQIYSMDAKTLAEILKLDNAAINADIKASKLRDASITAKDAAAFYAKSENVITRLWA